VNQHLSKIIWANLTGGGGEGALGEPKRKGEM